MHSKFPSFSLLSVEETQLLPASETLSLRIDVDYNAEKLARNTIHGTLLCTDIGGGGRGGSICTFLFVNILAMMTREHV